MSTVTVRPGDTLSAIAKKAGISLGVLIDVNRITDPNKIKVGQVLTIPSMSTDIIDHPVAPLPSPVTATPASLAINQQKFRLTPDNFFPEEKKKDLIVLHYTAGSTVDSAFFTWDKSEIQIATAYVIDLDGTIYEFFDPKFWAFHLGVSAPNRTHPDHKRSIGIELVNVGELRPDAANPNQLNWWPPTTSKGLPAFRQKFCMRSETSKYLETPYRGAKIHATFPEPQVVSTLKLVRHLCDRFKIPKRIPPPEKRQEPKADFKFATKFTGVISHQSFSDDRIDMGPAWDWSRLFG